MTHSMFRKLLFVSIVLSLAAMVVAVFPTYSEALAIAYENEPQPWFMENPWIFGGVAAVLLLAWLASLVGLFLYKPWGRTLSLYSTFAALLVTPFIGVLLSSGIESALFDASSMVWGAVLALSYFSPVSDRFGR